MTARITATPEVGLIDSRVGIRLDGFAPSSVVEVRARVDVPGRSTWTSAAEFLVGRDGSVDLATATPLFGSYLVPDAEGLLWSLRADPASPVRPVNSRFIDSGLREYAVELTAVQDDVEIAAARLRRRPVDPSVTRTEVRDRGLVATLFTPAGDGPHPLIVVVPGSDGGIPEHIAALYASHGWASLALAYFNAGEPGALPATLTEIPLEYFETALSWIADHPALDETRLLLSGTSRGGELALLLGSRYPEFRSVIAWVPSLYVNGGMGPDDRRLGRSSWTKDGVPLPFLARGIDESATPDERDGVQVFSIRGLRGLDRAAARPFEIPVERINGPILFVSGRDDLLWPSDAYSRWAIDRLEEHGFPHAVQWLSYPNAGHSVGPNGSPATILGTAELPGADPARRVGPIHLGGNPQGIAAARQDLWPKVLAFIAESFARERADAGDLGVVVGV